jgi:hypothetical protein
MERTYDIFEILPDGNPVWRKAVIGHEASINKMRELASQSQNEFRVIHLPTNSLVAVLNPREQSGSGRGESGEKSNGSQCEEKKTRDVLRQFVPQWLTHLDQRHF